MQAYYINLAARTDRRANMEARFEALGIIAERVEALTPAVVTDQQRARYCNVDAHRWQSEGELACSLSHAEAMRRFLETDAAFAAIFEDDTILSPSLGRLLQELDRAAPAIDLLRLEADNVRLRLAPQAESTVAGYALFRLHSAVGGAAGYIVSRAAAQRILEGEEILSDPADEALFNPAGTLSKILVVRQLDPALVLQEDRLGTTDESRAGSDLEVFRRQRGETDGRNFWRRSGHNFRDFVQRDIITAAYNFWLAQAQGVRKRAIAFKPD